MRCLIKDYPFDNHLQLLNLNLNGPFNHLQPIVKHMMRHRTGHIVGITSASAKLPTAYRSSCACSKNAFVGLLDSLRTELKPFNINVSNIMPGYVKTPLPYNAMSSEVGKKFGSGDTNIENGMEPEAFSDECVKAIFNKETECQISKDWFAMPFAFTLKAVLPDAGALFLRLNAKNQKKAIEKKPK